MLKTKYNLISKSKEILADTETPVSAFIKVCKDQKYSFLLESVENNEKLGRYSIIGKDPLLTFTNKDNKTQIQTESESIELEDNPFDALNSLIKSIDIPDSDIKDFLGFVGYFGFENIRWVEPRTNLENYKLGPDVQLILPSKVIVFDHILNKVTLIANDLNEDSKKAESQLEELDSEFKSKNGSSPLELNYENKELSDFSSNFTKDEYMEMVNKAKEYIRAGDIFQIVPSQKMKVQGKFDGFSLYRTLRSINPSPYLFYLNFGEAELTGSSPEVMVKCEIENGKKVASVRPIAGTYPRGKTTDEDLKNYTDLQNDPKEKAEHLMLVDLARNDLGRVCNTGSIHVPELMVIEKYSHVFHMVSLVQGLLEEGKTSVDLLAACFPHGTLSGAPKIRAIEIINELESPNQRGPYGGCLGFFGLNDTINTCMTIRTFIVREDHLEIQAGGGVVADSDPENEYNETLRKGAALLKSISMLKSS